ncbi:helix-turn-helix domain-containing protein [Microbacterium pumilum]|uniref:HTH tetR-type domain-containing protein n=1 Tax=Microbacterium pumilum TaxID=344165 RepID=A0ABN2T2A9_9MICO
MCQDRISGGDTSTSIRAPRQKRSREAWARVLDAGVELLSERGYEGFTIAAICDSAGVAPRFIYDRVDNKDDLFLAVYEHGLGRVRAGQSELERDERWAGLLPEELVRGALGEVGARFRENAEFLRAIVLLSSTVAEVAQRGATYRAEFEGQFVGLLSRIEADIRHDDPLSAMRYCFDTAFAAWVVRVAYGPEFSALGLDDDQFDQHLKELGVRYLLR